MHFTRVTNGYSQNSKHPPSGKNRERRGEETNICGNRSLPQTHKYSAVKKLNAMHGTVENKNICNILKAYVLQNETDRTVGKIQNGIF